MRLGPLCVATACPEAGSQRALRPCAVYRKITKGFRSEWGADLDADIRSVVETGRRRAVRALDEIRLTLKGRAHQGPGLTTSAAAG